MSHRCIFKILIISSFVATSAFAKENAPPSSKKAISGVQQVTSPTANAPAQSKEEPKSTHKAEEPKNTPKAATKAVSHASKKKQQDFSHETIEQRRARMMDPAKSKEIEGQATQKAKHLHTKDSSDD